MRTEPPGPQPPLSREEYLALQRNLAELRRNCRDLVIVSPAMLSLALGIRLPEDVARGPLLTASRVNTTDLRQALAAWPVFARCGAASVSGPGATWS
jgi:hypothetical protein